MDLQNFYLDSKRRITSPFRFLRSATESSQKMSKPLHFPGVPVTDALFEEHCFAHLQNMAHSAHISFQEMAKNDSGGLKKACFDQYNRFPTITFSKLVGGFVGSKSHSGTSREPHQVWDVILRQVVDATVPQRNLGNNLMDCINCINVGKTVSRTMFGPFCEKRSSSQDENLTYFLASNCIFEEKETPCHLDPKESCANAPLQPQEKPYHLELSISTSEMVKEESCCEKPHDIPRQSYADVAKAFAAKRNKSLCERKDSKKTDCSPFFQRKVKLSGPSKVRRKFTKKDVSDVGSYVDSSLCSSRNNHNKKYSQNVEKPVNANNTKCFKEMNRHQLRAYSDQNKPSELQQYSISGKSKKDLENRKPRSSKYKNFNMKEKEKKNLGHQVQEDVSFICNNSEQNCKNWRCRHNRAKPVPSNRSESQGSAKHCKVNRTVCDNKVSSPSSADKFILKGTDHSSENGSSSHSLCLENLKESDCNAHLILSQDSQDSIGDVCSESSFSSGSSANSQPERFRVASECSVDSEDSIVFESDDCDPQVDQDYEESDLKSDCSSDSDTFQGEDSDCDEVDFCQLIEKSEAEVNPEYYQPGWLKDVNNKWLEENAMIGRKEKEPKKVRFAENKDLVKVHLLVKWDYAYRSARVGPWEEMARDRSRFRARITRIECVLAPIFEPDHRRRVLEERERSSAVM